MAAGLVWRARRTRWGAAPFLVAVLVAARLAGRSDWPRWDAMVTVGLIVTLVGGVGTRRLLADPSTHWGWVATGALMSVAGVWAGVPETGPALLAAGAIFGLAGSAALTGARWAPTAGIAVAAVLGWAALSGAAGRPWAALGGALCTGVAPWLALWPPFWAPSRSRSPSLRLLGAHMALVILAARWIGVNPHAGWGRVAIVAFAGLVVTVASRRRA